MKTLIEASAAFDQGAGIGRYSRNIVSRLLAMPGDDRWMLLRAPEQMRGSTSFFDERLPDTARVITLPLSRRNADRLWFRLRLPLDARLFAGGADVVYSPDFTAPPMAGVPRMVTVHDLAFLTHPDKTTDALRRYLEKVVPRQVEQADKVAVVSYATREDVRGLLGVPAHKIVVARNAVDERFYRARPLGEHERNRLGIPDRYLLMVGTVEPRKNHLGALRALEASGAGEDVPLVIAGKPGWGFEEAMSVAEGMYERGLVRLPNYVPDVDLPGLVAGATAMLYPSWTEGFGLPIAEAMATGIPVITGTAPALREVGGDLALYAHPEDVDGLAEHIRTVVGQPSTDSERRARREWTRQFSWDSSTTIVLESLREIAHTAT
jgi:glycosyltransferase involved in cell wall biosynthesis